MDGMGGWRNECHSVTNRMTDGLIRLHFSSIY